MSVSHMQEMSLYRQLATAIGDSLEDVCNMQERERKELITVLGLVVEVSDLMDSPGVEKSKYRTRTVAKMEEMARKMEKEIASSQELSGSSPADGFGGDGGHREVSGQDINAGDMDTSDDDRVSAGDIDTNTSDINNNTSVNAVVVQHSDGLSCTATFSDTQQLADSEDSLNTVKLTQTSPATSSNHSQPTVRPRSKLSLRRKGRKAVLTKSSQPDVPSVSYGDNFLNLDKILQVSTQPLPSFLVQKVSAGLDMPSSSSTPPATLTTNLMARLLSCHPLPVQTVLARRDLPRPRDGVVTVADGAVTVERWTEGLDKVFDNISNMKSSGLVHAGIGDRRGSNWKVYTGEQRIYQKLSENRVGKEGHDHEDTLARKTRSAKTSKLVRPTPVTGDWTWSSDEEVEGAGGEGRESKEMDEDWQPEKDVGKKKKPGDGRKGSDLKKKRVCKRRLFSNKKDYMDDSAESGKEEESHEDESRKKYGRTRKGVLNTVQKLKKEGSLPDLCGDKLDTQGWSLGRL